MDFLLYIFVKLFAKVYLFSSGLEKKHGQKENSVHNTSQNQADR